RHGNIDREEADAGQGRVRHGAVMSIGRDAKCSRGDVSAFADEGARAAACFGVRHGDGAGYHTDSFGGITGVGRVLRGRGERQAARDVVVGLLVDVGVGFVGRPGGGNLNVAGDGAHGKGYGVAGRRVDGVGRNVHRLVHGEVAADVRPGRTARVH